MIALDTNVLVRYLVNDDIEQAQLARDLLANLTSQNPGFICREVIMELAWVCDRCYGFSRDQIATVFEELIATAELHVEAAEDVFRAVHGYRRGDSEFSDQMIAAAASRFDNVPLYTFDKQVAQLDGAVLLT